MLLPNNSKRMIGIEYQAETPEGLCYYNEIPPYTNNDTLLWDPSHLRDSRVKRFLRRAAKQPSNAEVSDDEEALYLLLQSDYNTRKALYRMKNEILPNPLIGSALSSEECELFEDGVKSYGKDFYKIQQQKLPNKSVKDLVLFYYFWKKSERYDDFITKVRFKKKKYRTYPDSTNFMENFLQEEKESLFDQSKEFQEEGTVKDKNTHAEEN